jgi:hypothetical protein
MKTSALRRPASKNSLVLSAFAYLFIFAVVLLTIYSQRPPAPVSSDAAPTEFSAERAMEHLRVIAQRPHPVGSAAQEETRLYLLQELAKLGLTVETQKTVVVNERMNGASVVTVNNIIGQLKGTQPGGKAILLVAHYDSVPNGPGANDDGTALAALLETLRALKAGPPLHNDVIALFDEGEELGLLGAKAFVDDNPLAKNVGLVLNFEARGSEGPVFMFETSENNGWLINEFGKAAPRPFASSLMYTIYKLLPNDTDLTVFKKAGLPGLNFAYIGGSAYYHTQRDDLSTVDEGSLQHHGVYSLALTRHFGNLSLGQQQQSADAVYFDLLGLTLISYRSAYVLPVMFLTLILFGVVLALGLRKKELTWTGMALGFLVFLVSVVCSIILISMLWTLMTILHQDYTPMSNADIYIVSFIALAIAVTSALYIAVNRWVSFDNLSVGALAWWLMLMVAASTLLPGASYLLQYPLLFVLGAMAVVFAMRRETEASRLRLTLLSLCALPGLILMTGTLYNIFQGLMLGMISVLMILFLLLLGLLTPYLRFVVVAPFKWGLPATALTVSLAFLLIGHIKPAYDKGNPKPDSVIYLLDSDKNEALWASSNRNQDQWTSQFFTRAAEKKSLSNYFPNNERLFLVDKAPAVGLVADGLQVLDDRTNDGLRALHFKVQAVRGSRITSLYVEPGVKVLSAVINGKRIEYDERPGNAPNSWELSCISIPPDGVDVILETRQSGPVKLKMLSQSDGLPQIANLSLKPRPADLIPAMGSDLTLVSKSYIINTDASTRAAVKLSSDNEQ